jgi:hypothetical protein
MNKLALVVLTTLLLGISSAQADCTVEKARESAANYFAKSQTATNKDGGVIGRAVFENVKVAEAFLKLEEKEWLAASGTMTLKYRFGAVEKHDFIYLFEVNSEDCSLSAPNSVHGTTASSVAK